MRLRLAPANAKIISNLGSPFGSLAIISSSEKRWAQQGSNLRPLACKASATAAFGEERTRELHAHGAGLDWDQAVAYTLTQAAAALEELQPGIPA